MSHERGQDPQGACCFCTEPCGFECEQSDAFECSEGGGFWHGEGSTCSEQLCLDEKGGCNECQGNECLGNDDCPEGYTCLGGFCRPTGFVNPLACNRDGFPNCEKVVHVKRPYFIDGTPKYSEWGLAINFLECDTGEPPDKDDLGGVVSMDLLLDKYDEEGNPDGTYKTGCCCDLYIQVVACHAQCPPTGFKCCISLKGVCVVDIPDWDVETEILIIKGKVGTDAEGFCGYSAPPTALDICGNPATEWVISSNCAWGDCGEGQSCIKNPCCDCHCLCPKFVDLDITVVEFHEDWLNDVDGVQADRYCLMACDSCWGNYKPCSGSCDTDYYPDGLGCITQTSCEDNGSTAMLSPAIPGDCYGLAGITNQCHERVQILTGEEVANSNDLYYMSGCETTSVMPWWQQNPLWEIPPCDMCKVQQFTLCACATLGGCECHDVKYSWYHPEIAPCEPINNNSVGCAPYHRYATDGECTNNFGDSPYGCYTNNGGVMPGDLPNNAKQSGGSWFTPQAVNCNLGNYGIRGCNYSCSNLAHLCEPDLIETPRNNSYFPETISTTISIEFYGNKADIDLMFLNPIILNDEENTTSSEISHNNRMPWQYQLDRHSDMREIEDFSSEGVALVGVPMVKEAIHLGAFDKDGGQWSAWLHVTPCVAQTVTKAKARHFSFLYSLFAVCDCKRLSVDCNCNKDSFEIGKTKGVSFQV